MKILAGLKTLKRRHKLAMIAVAILLPILLLCGIFAHNVSGTITDTRQELAGVDYLRNAWTMIAACDGGRPIAAGDFELPSPSVKPLPALEAAERSLAQRLVATQASADTCDGARAHIRRVADDSRLALDPQPDSYYLISAMVNDLPALSSHLDEPQAGMASGVTSGTFEARAAIQAQQVNAAGASVLHTLNLAESGGDVSLRSALNQGKRNLSEGLDDEMKSIRPGTPGLTSRRVLRGTVDDLWVTCANQLERLLQHRIVVAMEKLWLTLGGALTLAMVAIGVVFYFDLYGQRDEVLKLNGDLRQSNDELERFAYVCSHDMQEPVRMMHLYAGMLMEDAHDSLDEVSRRHLNHIMDNARRLRKMISDILQFSRVGRDPLPIELVDCNGVLGEVLEDFSREIAAKAVSINASTLPVIATNPTLVYIVLQNLIGNSLKYQDGLHPPEIDISAQHEGGKWCFRVRDNGIGIDPAYRDKVFAIFQRLNRQEDYPGSGVGLSTCRKFLTLAGGEIDFTSEPGKGTTFWFTLPDKTAK